MPDILQEVIPYVVAGMTLLALILFLLALWYFRRSRRDPYWRLRRAASQHGWLLFVVSVTMMFLASGICLFSGLATAILEPVSPTLAVEIPTVVDVPEISPTIIPTEEPSTAQPTRLIEPSSTPTATSTSTAYPSATQSTPTVTATSTDPPTATRLPASPTAVPPTAGPATPVPLRVIPLESEVDTPPDAQFAITAIDSAVDADLQPVSPGGAIASAARRIYFWISYSGMVDGAAWERMLVRDGELVQSGAYLWSGGETGVAVHFFGDSDGFAAGQYEIRLSLNGALVASEAFLVE